MADTHEIGLRRRFFWQILQVPHKPALISRGWSTQIEPPFRRAVPVVLRIPFTTFAIAFGYWKDTGWEEEEALLAALAGWGVDLFEDPNDDDEWTTPQMIREAVSAQGLDLDDEWRVISALGVAE